MNPFAYAAHHAGVHPAAMHAAMHAVSQTPAFHALALNARALDLQQMAPAPTPSGSLAAVPGMAPGGSGVVAHPQSPTGFVYNAPGSVMHLQPAPAPGLLQNIPLPLPPAALANVAQPIPAPPARISFGPPTGVQQPVPTSFGVQQPLPGPSFGPPPQQSFGTPQGPSFGPPQGPSFGPPPATSFGPPIPGPSFGPPLPMPIDFGNFPAALATTGPDPAAPAYQGGPGAAYGSSPSVVDRPITDVREFPLGFGPTSFPAGTEASVISRPQVTFRGERVVIPSTVAPFFTLIDVKVGNRSQLVNSVALPAQMFIELAVGVRLSFDTAQTAQDVALIVANGSANATTFQAAIIGTAAQ